MTTKGLFGFVDPAGILWRCHIIPAFSSGRAHSDGHSLLHSAVDSNDWKDYYLNQ